MRIRHCPKTDLSQEKSFHPDLLASQISNTFQDSQIPSLPIYLRITHILMTGALGIGMEGALLVGIAAFSFGLAGL